MHSPRRAAVSVLRAWAKGVDYAESLVERQAVRRQLSAPDRALLNALVLGALRHRRLLDHWLAGLRRGRLDHETRDILRVGLCQLLILGLPDHAAVFETVQLGRAPVRGLLNAVLRRAANRRQRLLDEARELPLPTITGLILGEIGRLVKEPPNRKKQRKIPLFTTVHRKHLMIEE